VTGTEGVLLGSDKWAGKGGNLRAKTKKRTHKKASISRAWKAKTKRVRDQQQGKED